MGFPRSGITTRISSIKRRPTADIAVLRAADILPKSDENGYPSHAFWDGVSNFQLGEQFMTYGFPVAAPSPDMQSGVPAPRLFLGHYQRFLTYAEHRYRYLAGEMSIPAPAGLSGSPMFRPGAHLMITGLVTTNLTAYSTLDSIEEEEKGGAVYRYESRRVIEYGLALMLGGVAGWLKDVVSTSSRPWLLREFELNLD